MTDPAFAAPTLSDVFSAVDADVPLQENPDFLSKQLITYLGNKRAFRRNLERAIMDVRQRLGGRKISSLDLFAGSGFVSRLLKRHSTFVMANDLERYAEVVNRCFLTNYNVELQTEVTKIVKSLNHRADSGESIDDGFIRTMYSPVDDRNIALGERVFYTNDNARRLDFFAHEIACLDEPVRTMLLGPLLSKASIHANTSGVFKGFYKDKNTGIGKFGAAKGDALKRILEPIRLEVPVLSAYECQSEVTRSDANDLVSGPLPVLDLAYIDPPYNQHPYGSNYFMLNLLVDYAKPREVSKVSGIPTNWNRSGYNVKRQALPLMADLLQKLPTRFILVSFNAEGYISIDELRDVLTMQGKVDEVIAPYNAFRGSRNLRNRSIYVNEHLFLLDRDS